MNSCDLWTGHCDACSSIGATQLARLAHSDSEDALVKYLELCRLGGTRSVLELFAAVGLRSPFDPGVTGDLAGHMRNVLHSARGAG